MEDIIKGTVEVGERKSDWRKAAEERGKASGDGGQEERRWGPELWSVADILEEAGRLSLPIRPSAGGRFLLVDVEGPGPGIPAVVVIIAGADGSLYGWRRDRTTGAADSARMLFLPEGGVRLCFFRRMVITGSIDVPGAEDHERLCLLASASRILAWLAARGIVPGAVKTAQELELALETISQGTAVLSFTLMGEDYVIDTLSLDGRRMKAYGIDVSGERRECWGARLRVRTAGDDGILREEEVRAVRPGSAGWLDEEFADILG